MKVVIEAGQTKNDGWLSTKHWRTLSWTCVGTFNLRGRGTAANHCYQYLEPDGYIHYAVPDKTSVCRVTKIH